MKTKLPSKITTVDEAKALLKSLHDNGESFHPEDDARNIVSFQTNRSLFTDKEGETLNRLMNEIYSLDGQYTRTPTFDPCEYLLELDGHLNFDKFTREQLLQMIAEGVVTRAEVASYYANTQWDDDPEADDDEQEAVAAAIKKAGYSEQHTGGGCMAYVKKMENGNEAIFSHESELPTSLDDVVSLVINDNECKPIYETVKMKLGELLQIEAIINRSLT